MEEGSGKKNIFHKLSGAGGKVWPAVLAAVILFLVFRFLADQSGGSGEAVSAEHAGGQIYEENVLESGKAGFQDGDAGVPGSRRAGILDKDADAPGNGTADSLDQGIAAGGTDDGQGETVDPQEIQEETEPGYDLVLSFAGDICFDETCAVMQDYISRGEKLENNISAELLRQMNEADVCWINNEFAYSDRGEPLENKMYTFRAGPERAGMLLEMGVDIAGLANNHVYDYGPDAMGDTLDILRQAGIEYVGAGKNLAEAMTPVYKEAGGITIAYVAASRAEKYKMTPQASENEAGILRCYDTELFLEEIREAEAQADFVIALVHWGTEYSTELEEVQMSTGRDYIDAGADIVIGAHPHCLQGMEFYQGKPIIYSLGNFWFNEKSLDTMLLQVCLSGDDADAEITAENVKVQIIPAKQENCRTEMLEGEEAERLFDYLEGLSEGLEIDEEGVVREIQNSVDRQRRI